MGLCVWDDPNDKTFRQDLGNGEADAIDGDRSLANDVARKLRGQLYLDAQIGALLLEPDDSSGAIYMSLDEVTSERGSSRDGLLEIHRIACRQLFQVSSNKRLMEQIERELVLITGGHGKAAAIHRDACSQTDSCAHLRRIKPQLAGVAVRSERNDGADFFDQAGKHSQKNRAAAGRSKGRSFATAEKEINLVDCAGSKSKLSGEDRQPIAGHPKRRHLFSVQFD